MIFSTIGIGYGAYAGAKKGPGTAASYALLGSLFGGILDVLIVGGILYKLYPEEMKQLNTPEAAVAATQPVLPPVAAQATPAIGCYNCKIVKD